MVKQLSKEHIRKLANQLMFDLSDQEIEDIQHEFATLITQMETLNRIDTDQVQEMIFPFEETRQLLRSDEEIYNLSKEDVLKNAPLVQDDYMVVPKVVD